MIQVDRKLVNVETGEIVGYRYTNGIYSAVVSESKAVELGLEDAEILRYLSIDCVLNVFMYNGKYFIEDNATGSAELPDGIYGTTVSISDNQFNLYNGCDIDNELAIKRMLSGKELL